MILITLLTIFWTSITVLDNTFVATPECALQKAESALQEQKVEIGILWYHYALFQLDEEESTSYQAYIHYKLAELYYSNEVYDNSIHHIRKAIRFNTNEHIAPILRYNLGRGLIMNHDYASGELQLLRSRMAMEDPVLKLHITLFLARLYGLLNDGEQMAYYLNQARESQLDLPESIEEQLVEANHQINEEINLKSENKAKIFSSILPGSGQLYAQQYRNSAGALLINTATTALMVRSVNLENYHHTLLIGAMLWWRYYDGNRDNAIDSVREYNRLQRSSTIHKAMQSLERIYREPYMQKNSSLSRKQF